MSAAVPDTYLWNDVERETPGTLEDFTQNHSFLLVNSVISFTTLESDNPISINTEATEYDNYIPDETDVPLSEVISEAF
ncbi:hypothetical protein EB796_004300 [Bugula neritina]|uniref:Uncharacterized protein n=1 Tax=Bugula neritina TaxID=10212 RepID=A0A7J7KIZ8_BUGNE|nr:hypothetical protein EB796_004300 [Bugula neritina]